MVRILIVDDQDAVRNGLKKMISEMEIGIDDVYEASDGEEAMKIVAEANPEIILVDIMMPRLNGLQLIEDLKNNGCTSHIAIISAYNDFDYTKKAINFKVDDYILKPVSKDELYKLLMSLKRKIDDGIEKINRLKEREHKYYFRLLYDYLSGQDVLTNLKEIFEGVGVFFANHFFRIAVICCEGAGTEMLEDIRQAINARLRAAGILFVSFYNECWKLLYILNMQNPGDLTCAHIIEDHTNNSMLKLNCGISEPLDGIQSLRKLYSQADMALKESMFRGVKVCLYSEIKKDSKANVTMNEHIKLLDLFSRGMKNELDRTVDEIFLKLSSTMPNVNVAVSALFTMLNYLYINLAALYPDICDIESVRSRIEGAGSFFKMKVVVKETINDMYKKFLEFNRKDYSNYIANYIVNSIRDNYHKKISLYHIAEELSMNYNYVSGLFTKKTGMTFQEYLTRFRLEKAKELLKSGDYKMYEVSDRCGFYDSKYFCKAFKKRFNMTPGEYRHRFC